MGSRHSKPFAPAILTSCCCDWDMPVLNGIEALRIVFPRRNLPVTMLTTRAQRSHVNKTLRAGANEFMLKPTSPKPLCDWLMAIVFKPRPMVKVGTFNVPQPRRTAASRETAHAG